LSTIRIWSGNYGLLEMNRVLFDHAQLYLWLAEKSKNLEVFGRLLALSRPREYIEYIGYSGDEQPGERGQMPCHVLILIAHTGGGHLRAAEAVAEALRRRHGADVTTEILDAVGEYGPFPFNHLDWIYRHWVGSASLSWRWGYRTTDEKDRADAILRVLWPLVWPRAQRLFMSYSADVIVSAHPLTNHYAAWALKRLDLAVPLVTLVTDPVSVHPFWLSTQVDCCMVGSTEARRKALECGLSDDRISVTGHPVNPVFSDGLLDKATARRGLGWSLERPSVLLLGGGEGMGNLYQTARELETAHSGVQIAVVAGRNRRLKERIEKANWRVPVQVYGFVQNAQFMSQLMSAADLLITKAGPGSIHEAFLAGLPLVLNAAVPGQEEGNVRLVVEGGAGEWAPGPTRAAQTAARWTRLGRVELERRAACARALARPDAAFVAADEVWRLALTKL
jgi:1,2-diacylglycerol 3-beta-galactosyltransferase